MVNKNIIIDDKEIEKLEKLLLKTDRFDDNRIRIIKNFNSSFDVNACPGSGKTTILLAKLKLIIDRLPFEDDMGICVLTHTNVAINEIKKRLGSSGEVLFKYPNYIGTIQGFINKFLTMPFYKSVYKKNINVIDNYEYEKYLEKILKDCGWTKDDNTWVNNSGRRVSGNKKLLSKKINIKNSIFNINLPKLQQLPTDIYNQISRIMLEILENGFLTYRDTYDIADLYIESNDNIKELFKNRFKFVFIDEMQDTNLYQSRILSKLFDNDKTIVQRFGDKNQDISPIKDDDEKCGWDFKNLEEINSSKRYGKNIATVLNYIKREGEKKLVGNDAIESLKPHIIVFDSDSELLVLNKFEDLINTYNLYSENSVFKAIGRIGVEKNKDTDITIKSYNKNYTKKNAKDDHNYKNELMHSIYNNSIVEFLNTIIKIIFRLLKNNKNYSKDTIKKTLQNEYNDDYMEFKSNCLNFYRNLKENSDIDNNLKDLKIYIENLVKKVFGDNIDTDYLERYFNNNGIDKKVATNRYNINFDTVHAVKGETHTATLYLQTRFNKSNMCKDDIDKIIDFMDGTNTDNIKNVDDLDVIEALNIAYVAMSRPTNLLCIAIHIDSIKDKIKNLKSVGYIILGCTDNLQKVINEGLI